MAGNQQVMGGLNLMAPGHHPQLGFRGGELLPGVCRRRTHWLLCYQ